MGNWGSRRAALHPCAPDCAGGVIGGVAGLALLVGVAYMVLRKKTQTAPSPTAGAQPAPVHPAPSEWPSLQLAPGATAAPRTGPVAEGVGGGASPRGSFSPASFQQTGVGVLGAHAPSLPRRALAPRHPRFPLAADAPRVGVSPAPAGACVWA